MKKKKQWWTKLKNKINQERDKKNSNQNNEYQIGYKN
jgi:hypothetical protein